MVKQDEKHVDVILKVKVRESLAKELEQEFTGSHLALVTAEPIADSRVYRCRIYCGEAKEEGLDNFRIEHGGG